MFEDEYIIRLIKSGVKTAVALFAGKDAVKSDIDIQNYNMTLSEDELLEFMIKKYISEGKINEAENILFEVIEFRKTKKNLETALFFYEELNKWDEDKLLKCNFSKSEIEKGLKDVRKLYEKE
ncbi:hypothetical protein BD780_001179 [Clostridium tetanomorphum]|uniref:Uncharacterized protein n=1 Tax=Clostridium tetanomorphum TaxID=1553 RepID=A0A923EAX6_CLOTT|nr:DUF6483 family protein [Clostridium tetanomorphum]KAJ52387.1 hypothetical protein CTM_07811 [Clostridium tetanomorphum DSM 665]MBC2397906.1 hypothetical protein [Clostridium tetanomorphum]MBP1864778.1 hypothetical protein [Clostridium tetanomorphum]NRS83954.1 hypothetical protein [Clostridium tetanomorphum]NRZ97173.1 hypothetical protein [Clostridium tetanomorphum]